MATVTKKIVVQRPPIDPWLLVKFAESKNMTPVEALADVLGRHATNAGAAKEIGCHPAAPERIWAGGGRWSGVAESTRYR